MGHRQSRAEKSNLFQMADYGVTVQFSPDLRMFPRLGKMSMEDNVKLLRDLSASKQQAVAAPLRGRGCQGKRDKGTKTSDLHEALSCKRDPRFHVANFRNRSRIVRSLVL